MEAVTINLTSNLKLQKPTSDEKYNVQTQNTNMDILDSSIKALQDKDATLTKQADFETHTSNKSNPHNVTKEQLGLSNVVNQRQIPAIQIAVTDGGVPVFDGNGYTLKDSGFTVETSVPADAKFTDTVYTHPSSGIIPDTYNSVSVDVDGHVVSGNNPTTLAGYGITDAASVNHTHTAEEVGADAAGSAGMALSQAKEYTDLKVAEYQGENILKKQIVESLPTENIDTNTIYLILKPDANGNNNYNEYINLDGTSSGYEWIGNTFVDLTDYYNKTETNNLFLLKADVTNNLTSTSTSSALSANQGRLLNSTKANINSSNNFSGIQASIVNDTVPTYTSFVNAQFVATANSNTNANARAGYGFHNANINGVFLYLDSDGLMKVINSGGNKYTLAYSESVNVTGEFSIPSTVSSFSATRTGKLMRITFTISLSGALPHTNTVLTIPTHYAAKYTRDFLVLNYSGWSSATQAWILGSVNGTTITIFNVNDSFIYTRVEFMYELN